MVRHRLRLAIDEARRGKMEPAELEALFREEVARAAGPGNGAAAGHD
jgi:hypothetical protein